MDRLSLSNFKKPAVLEDDDVLFFYGNFLGKTQSDIENRERIDVIAERYGITIKFHKSVCKGLSRLNTKNTIHIFQTSNQFNKCFIKHCRNAFAHLNIIMESGECQILDWSAINDEGANRTKVKMQYVTMIGSFEYHSFKSLINEFFLDESKNRR